MSATTTRSELDRLTGMLLQHELALVTRPVVVEHNQPIARVTWQTIEGGAPFLDEAEFAGIRDWKHAVENGHYSVMLYDGSLLQMSFVFRRDDLRSHRLSYLPCPIRFGRNDLRDEVDIIGLFDLWLLGISDTLSDAAIPQQSGRVIAPIPELFDLVDAGVELSDSLSEQSKTVEGEQIEEEEEQGETATLAGIDPQLVLRSPIRFDYDPDAHAEGHPISHLHISHQQCRIPVFGPLSIGHFVRFIFRHFYPSDWGFHEFLREWPLEFGNRSVIQNETHELFFDCQRHIVAAPPSSRSR